MSHFLALIQPEGERDKTRQDKTRLTPHRNYHLYLSPFLRNAKKGDAVITVSFDIGGVLSCAALQCGGVKCIVCALRENK